MWYHASDRAGHRVDITGILPIQDRAAAGKRRAMGREGKGREGKGREGKGREGKGREGKGGVCE
jgi:hypothetical protein